MLPVLFSRPSISMWARLHPPVHDRRRIVEPRRRGGMLAPYARERRVCVGDHPVRWVAPERSPGAGTVGCAGYPIANCKLELHAEDEDRLLQGCQRARHLSGVSLRLSGVYVSAPASEGEEGEVVRRVHAGVEQRGRPRVCGRPCAAGGGICGMTSRWRRLPGRLA